MHGVKILCQICGRYYDLVDPFLRDPALYYGDLENGKRLTKKNKKKEKEQEKKEEDNKETEKEEEKKENCYLLIVYLASDIHFNLTTNPHNS